LQNNAYACALRLLARREHGAHELASKLAKKGFAQLAIADALSECQRLGLQSDSRFVEMVCRARIHQGQGPIRIRQELQQLRIESELIASELQKETDHWVAHATAVLKKKYKEEGEVSYIVMQKQKQFLVYRGFSMDTIALVFNHIHND
jgi:regulatory protein